MNLHDLRSSDPPSAVRAMLAAEVIIYLAALAACIWWAMPAWRFRIPWYHVVLGLLVAGAPAALNLLHGDRPRDGGLRLDNLGASAREVAAAVLAMAAGVVLVGLLTGGFHWVSWSRLRDIVVLYLAWGLVQQYLLQSFTLRRLMQARLPAPLAVAIAAGAFGLLHSPNWALVAATSLGGVAWCLLFLRRPNILTLGAAHAMLAVLLYHAWNTMGMTIGPIYLNRVRIGWHGP